ncbi:MAG: histidine kinase dimerization/phospho-acceptor domain-containing protein, partial [Myxococcota bacterium]
MTSTTTFLQRLNVVIIDDDEDHADLSQAATHAALRSSYEELHFHSYRSPAAALADLPTDRTLVLLDYRLANETASDWIPDFVRADVGPVVVITSSGDEQIAAAALRAGASDYVTKEMAFAHAGQFGRIVLESLRRYELQNSTRTLTKRLKEANAELTLKSEKLSVMSATAHRFVEDVAHEFRTPLAVIQEFAAIMRDGIGGDTSSQQDDYLGFIANASRDLSQLVDDFLDGGKLRAGTLRVARKPLD